MAPVKQSAPEAGGAWEFDDWGDRAFASLFVSSYPHPAIMVVPYESRSGSNRGGYRPGIRRGHRSARSAREVLLLVPALGGGMGRADGTRRTRSEERRV